jgi:hypothetical protein
MTEVSSLQRRVKAVHAKTRYEDLAHSLLALEIAQHAMEETLEHTGLGGEIRRKSNRAAYQRVKGWLNIIRGVQTHGKQFLKTHFNEDLETALKALEIAHGSLQEVAERYE